jgi:hypothetical protein
MKTVLLVGTLILGASSVGFAQQADTRGGTCEDAKKQHEYYCEGKGDPNDIFTQANIACNNAKRNVAAACEGKVEADVEYKFEKEKKQ